jgi:phage shock protein A
VFFLKCWNIYETEGLTSAGPQCVVHQSYLEGIGECLSQTFEHKAVESREIKCRAKGDGYCAFFIVQKENDEKVAEWMRKAELAVDKKQDDLARAALLRVESYREMTDSFAQQVADQKAQVENLKTALRQLEQKLSEAQAKADVLIAKNRRARALGKASDARMHMGDDSKAAAFDRMKRKVAHNEAVSQAKAEIAADDVEGRLAALEKEDRIDQLLADLKSKRGA